VRPPVLSLAGSDPSGGAGLQMDLKVFEAFGCHGMAIETLLTVQSQKGLRSVHPVPDTFLQEALLTLLADLPPRAVKIGALGSPHTATLLPPLLPKGTPIVLDPVLGASRGKGLGSNGLADVLRELWLPLCTLVTPNLEEAAALAGEEVSTVEQMEHAAKKLVELGAKAALVKGGHLCGPDLVDLLWDGRTMHRFVGSRFKGPSPHGTGCALSAGIACELAKAVPLHAAVARSRDRLRGAWPKKGVLLEFGPCPPPQT